MLFKRKQEEPAPSTLETVSHWTLPFIMTKFCLMYFVYSTVLHLLYYCFSAICLIKILQTAY